MTSSCQVNLGQDLIDSISIDIAAEALGTSRQTTYMGEARISQVVVTIQVRCADGFYGPDCLTPCASFVSCAGCGLSGFYGQFCQNIDHCVGVNCNNGQCVDEADAFRCDCVSGFTGGHCETNIDDCEGVDCSNGACVDGVGGFRCECSPGFTGDRCQTNIDDCEGVDCNNGSCVDGVGGSGVNAALGSLAIAVRPALITVTT